MNTLSLKIVKDYCFQGFKRGALFGCILGLAAALPFFSFSANGFFLLCVCAGVSTFVFACLGWTVYGGLKELVWHKKPS